MKEKRIIYLIMGVSSILILLIGITTAWFTWQSETNTNVTFEVSGLNITSTNTNITGTLYPTMDKNNGVVEEFTIKQNNDISTPVCANITLNLTTLPTELNHESFRYKIYNGTNLIGSGNFANTLEGETITIATSQPITTTLSTYKLYIWIDGENYDNPLSMGGKSFLFKLTIKANQQENACTPSVACDADDVTPNTPVLAEGMIPIKWDGSKWVKASTDSWYNYSNKEWANAVMVRTDKDSNVNGSRSREQYMSADEGTKILEDDILAYYVWIPRYKYQLFNVSSEVMDPIEICTQFEGKGTDKSSGTANGDWLTHPAFTFGTTELAGIWVGKFSTTGDATTPTIKPNLGMLTNQNVSTQFTTSQIFGTTTYLTSTGVSEVDAHMMKNTEWGAVAYLKQSKYGLGTTDIGLNNYNSSPYLTGCGSTSGSSFSTTCNAYNTTDGMLASTTGNITGIYDMSAYTGTYVMGVMQDNTGTNTPMSGYSSSYNSGFTGKIYDSSNFTDFTGTPFPNTKYYDLYAYGTTYSGQTAYNRRILGDATGEVHGWYDDFAYFVNSYYPWFIRGSIVGGPAISGVFTFYYFEGKPLPKLVFRSVLAPGA